MKNARAGLQVKGENGRERCNNLHLPLQPVQPVCQSSSCLSYRRARIRSDQTG